MKVLIVDDHSIVRKGLKVILSKEFNFPEIHEAPDGIQALHLSRIHTFNVILMNIIMPGINGLETLIQMRAEGIKTPILMVSAQEESAFALRFIKAGATGYLNKSCVIDELVKAVQRVISGRKYVSEKVANELANSIHNSNDFDQLSAREIEVFELISNGKTVTLIAQAMSLSVNTVSTYRSRILEKLKLQNNSELIRYAIQNNRIIGERCFA